MISHDKALTFISDLAKEQNAKHSNHQHTTLEWIILMRRTLQKAEDAWYEGKLTRALHAVASASACGVTALEQTGESEEV